MTLIVDDVTEITDASIVPYTKLAIAVIKQAIEDATHDLAPPTLSLKHYADERSKYRQHLIDRQEARTFLTTENIPLRAWCRMAGLNVHTVLHYSKGAATDWVGLGERFSLHQRHVRKERQSERLTKKDDLCPPDANQ